MTDGFYSKLSQRIKQISDQQILVINVKDLAECIDITEMDEAEKDRRLKQAMASVALYQNGFRSVERGSGYFLDYKNCDNPVYLHKLCENAEIDSRAKNAMLKVLQQIKQKNLDGLPEYPQFTIDFENLGQYVEEITKEQIIEMLRKDAEAAIYDLGNN